jgi:hypothetical protein
MRRTTKILLAVMIALAVGAAVAAMARLGGSGEAAPPAAGQEERGGNYEARKHMNRVSETGVFDDAAREFVDRKLAETDLMEQGRAVHVLEALVRKDSAQLQRALHLWQTRSGAATTANHPLGLLQEIRLYRAARRERLVLRSPGPPIVEERAVRPELDPRRFVAAMEAASAHIRRVGERRTLDEDAKRFVTAQLAEPGLAAQHLGALVLHRLVEADPAQLDTALRLWRARAREEETLPEPLAIGVELTLYRAWRKASPAAPPAEDGRG